MALVNDRRVAVHCSMAVMLLVALLVVSATFSPCQAATADGDDETRRRVLIETCVEDFYCGLLRCEATCLRSNLDPSGAHCKQHGNSAYCCCSHRA